MKLNEACQRVLRAIEHWQVQGVRVSFRSNPPQTVTQSFSIGVPEVLLNVELDGLVEPVDYNRSIRELSALEYVRVVQTQGSPFTHHWNCRHIEFDRADGSRAVMSMDSSDSDSFAFDSKVDGRERFEVSMTRPYPRALLITGAGLKASRESDVSVVDQLVTLDQVAPLTGRKKRTLERYLHDGKIPEPDIRGENGSSNKWLWSRLRGPLEGLVNRKLPMQFPGSRII